MQLRTLHAYIGMLIAPTVLFMALTGLLQVYSLHEDHGAYHAPRALEVLGSLHKDQKLPGAEGSDDHDHDHAAAPAAKGAGAPSPHTDHDAHDHKGPAHPWAVALLKVVFAAVAVGLFASTCIGLWMAWQSRLRRRTHMILLAVGAVIPLVLALLAS
ncbi:MAG TPA: hypothetical protein VG407_11025 [Caulobacteraceae bacterium]|jgi:hypothetical protein|nr:hypothetical protein [Caulobacteraceae bacterium]